MFCSTIARLSRDTFATTAFFPFILNSIQQTTRRRYGVSLDVSPLFPIFPFPVSVAFYCRESRNVNTFRYFVLETVKKIDAELNFDRAGTPRALFSSGSFVGIQSTRPDFCSCLQLPKFFPSIPSLVLLFQPLLSHRFLFFNCSIEARKKGKKENSSRGMVIAARPVYSLEQTPPGNIALLTRFIFRG